MNVARRRASGIGGDCDRIWSWFLFSVRNVCEALLAGTFVQRALTQTEKTRGVQWLAAGRSMLQGQSADRWTCGMMVYEQHTDKQVQVDDGVVLSTGLARRDTGCHEVLTANWRGIVHGPHRGPFVGSG